MYIYITINRNILAVMKGKHLFAIIVLSTLGIGILIYLDLSIEVVFSWILYAMFYTAAILGGLLVLFFLFAFGAFVVISWNKKIDLYEFNTPKDIFLIAWIVIAVYSFASLLIDWS